MNSRVLVLHECSNQLTGGAYYLQKNVLSLLQDVRSKIQIQFSHVSEISQVFKEFRPNAIYSLAPVIPSFDGIPFALTVWDTGHLQYPSLPEYHLTKGGWPAQNRDEYYRTRLSEASFVIVGTEAAKKNLQREYRVHPENIFVNPFPAENIASERINQTLTHNDIPVIFYPANFWPHKNHILLIDALAILKSKGISYQLIFTGSDKGNLSYIKEYAQSLGVLNQIKFLGFVQREKLMEIYKKCDLFIFPSLLGPDNLPPLEALTFNCKVAVANIYGAKEIYRDNVYYFDPYDSITLSEKIPEWLCANRVENFSSEFGRDKYIETFQQICNRMLHLSKLSSPFYKEIG